MARETTKKRTSLIGLRGAVTIPKAVARIEKEFGLPAGSVKLVYQTGRQARSDSTVGKLREHWES